MSGAPAGLIRAADALREAGRWREAEAAYARILGDWPGLADCWFNLAVVQRRSGHFEAALESYRQALAHGVSCPEEVRLNRAVIYSDGLHQDASAERELNEALRLNPNYVPALLNLANLHEDRGQREAAGALYERALRLEPHCHLALARLANLAPPGTADLGLITRLRAALSGASAADRAQLGFALGRLLDAAGDYGAAFAAYQAANEASRASVAPPVGRYDRDAQERACEQLIGTALPPPVPASAAPARVRSIFICGMFRSGSTLTEQLIAAHPGVAPGGELELLPRMIGSELRPYPEALSRAAPAQLARLAGDYRARIAELFPEAAWVTDKRPDNFLYIGLIKTLFPDALIVHTTRAALDNCLSVFFLHLDQRQAYALDLMDIGHYYRQYRKVMAHWHALYGADVIDFDYDAFVREPLRRATALFTALGLPFDAHYLERLGADRAIRTASVWQVREPLHRRSSGRARHYAPQLAALRAYLADLLPADAAP